jgi:hypothetical protein
MVWGLWSRVQGFGLRVGKMLRPSVECLRLSRVSGQGFMVYDLGFMV